MTSQTTQQTTQGQSAQDIGREECMEEGRTEENM